MIDGIKAVAFDIDGTLYPQYRLHVRIPWHFLTHCRIFFNFGLVRHQLRRTAPLPDFIHYQAILMSERLKCSTEKAGQLVDEIAYVGLEKFFKKIKPFNYIEETFKMLKDAGVKIAILSDFPPEQKGELWGLKPYCDKILSAEKIGALKPSKYTFGVMAMELGLKPYEILYVGNSARYDIVGAKSAGMKTAYFEPLWRRIFRRPLKEADISFKSYRHFQTLVLQ